MTRATRRAARTRAPAARASPAPEPRGGPAHSAILGYCTNVHAGESLNEARSAIDQYAPAVRRRLIEMALQAPRDPMGIGLWISARAASEILDEPEGAKRLRDWLLERGLVVYTLNGFPYRGFHARRVKHQVYEPSWERVERLLYTEQLAEILSVLAPRDLPGGASISSVPLGWGPTFGFRSSGASFGVASAQLLAAARTLARLEESTGVLIHLDLEPEPGCSLQRSRDVVEFFARSLACAPHERPLLRHLGVCHDICHAAVMWEEQAEVIRAYREAGISIGKVQLSSAIESGADAESLGALRAFAEERYLHQTCIRAADGSTRFFEDLPEALEGPHPPGSRLRSHFHVPLAAERLGVLSTTRAEVEKFLAAWPLSTPLPSLEVETYTWNVLPESMRPASLAEGIAAEVAWARRAVARMGAGA